MHILVTGANGFIGNHLIEHLLSKECRLTVNRISGIDTAPQARLNLSQDTTANSAGYHYYEGSFTDTELINKVLKDPVDLVFHLAAVPSGMCESNFKLGQEVNVLGTLKLFEALRSQERKTTMIFASSIAVYGKPQVSVLTDDTPPSPTLSYGTYKVIGEVLLQDYIRRGWLNGCAVRLPGIVTRPPEPNGAVSIFYSDLIRELMAGKPVTCPVSPKARSWLMSVGMCVRNLIHASTIGDTKISKKGDYSGSQSVFMLPANYLQVGDLVSVIAEITGNPDLGKLVNWQPDPWVEFNFGTYPDLQVPKALAMGFRADESLHALITDSLVRDCL